MNARVHRGMTLLEVMVAFFIVAIVIGLLMQVYVRTMRMRSRVEFVTQMTATARAVTDIVSRDLQGAFPLADALPIPPDVYADFTPGAEFRWEAPVDVADATKGFRRVTFISATDGGRLPFEDELQHEHAIVSLAGRSGTLMRKISALIPEVAATEGMPPTWVPGEHIDPDVTTETWCQVYATPDVAKFGDVGCYRGAAYYRTDSTQSSSEVAPDDDMTFTVGYRLPGTFTFDGTHVTATAIGSLKHMLKPGDKIKANFPVDDWYVIDMVDDSGIDLTTPYLAAPGTRNSVDGLLRQPLPVLAAIGMTEGRQLPDGVRPAGNYPLPGWIGEQGYRITANIITTKDGDAYRIYAKTCGTTPAYFGPNRGGVSDRMYIAIIEPMWWFVGEEIADVVFRPPAGYTLTGTPVLTGTIPRFIDVIVSMPDAESDWIDPLTGNISVFGKREYLQRVYLPAGG